MDYESELAIALEGLSRAPTVEIDGEVVLDLRGSTTVYAQSLYRDVCEHGISVQGWVEYDPAKSPGTWDEGCHLMSRVAGIPRLVEALAAIGNPKTLQD